jgi:hypothetical protein
MKGDIKGEKIRTKYNGIWRKYENTAHGKIWEVYKKLFHFYGYLFELSLKLLGVTFFPVYVTTSTKKYPCQ